ncbi:MAG: DUF3343 domain-containing protein [Treponema sp.]|nr:DUF3343 domain-containing protein [Treponema sp.]
MQKEEADKTRIDFPKAEILGNPQPAAEAVFTFSGTNQVIQAEQIFLDAGLKVRVMPIPPEIQSGCGLCLRLPVPEINSAGDLLEKSGIIPKQRYTRTLKNGKYELMLY